jgi:capsular exopolysaccharide synthesis family protein
MSRVDEAQRRATLGDDAHVAPLLPAAREDGSIEAYPREGRSGTVPVRQATLPVRQATVPVRQATVPAPQATVPARLTPGPIAAPRQVPGTQLGAFDPGAGAKLVGSTDISPVAAEQYRRLAGSLHQLQTESGLKTLMVTSSLPREGKTLTVTNLALTLSESYKRRVLLIDADLRRPSIHDVLRLPNSTGLSEALKSSKGRPHVVEVSPMLSVLTAGKPDSDPMAGLSSERMVALLEEWAAEFDWVLLDAPPVGLMPDANLLARATRAVVFVIAAGMTSHKTIERAIGEIGRDLIIGTVLNRIEDRQLPAAAYYQHYYVGAGPTE